MKVSTILGRLNKTKVNMFILLLEIFVDALFRIKTFEKIALIQKLTMQ